MEYSRKEAAMTALALVFVMAAVATAQSSERQVFLDLHNAARKDVGVADVTWNDTVAAYAASYAEQHRGDCMLEHSPMPPRPYGENLYGGYVGVGGENWTAAHAVKSWVDEKPNYDYASNSCASGKMCGHYTQVVWSSTTSIGCARVVCNGNVGVFIICNYSPPGNYPNQKPY